MLSITPDQLTSAGSFIARHWGTDGYRIESIESPTRAVSVFQVTFRDGSRFAVVADVWGNCCGVPESTGLAAVVKDMHARAVAP